MEYSKLTDHELLKVGGEMGVNDKYLNIEWRKRHSMNYPYILTSEGIIKNMVLDAFVADRECDQLILDQANKLRKKENAK